MSRRLHSGQNHVPPRRLLSDPTPVAAYAGVMERANARGRAQARRAPCLQVNGRSGGETATTGSNVEACNDASVKVRFCASLA